MSADGTNRVGFVYHGEIIKPGVDSRSRTVYTDIYRDLDVLFLYDARPVTKLSCFLMGKLRNKALVRRLTGLLSVLLLLQGLFPLHAHTELRLNASGELVQVCTIDGLRSVIVDEQGIVHEQPDEESLPSPAIALSQILTEALPDIPVTAYLPVSIHFEDIPEAAASLISVQSAALMPIRAPPV